MSSSTSRPETVVALAPTDVSELERIGGAIAILIFVSTWISSLLSPFLLINAIWKANYIVAGSIVGITVIAYAPWQKGLIANFVHRNIYYYFPRYFQSIVVEFEGKTLPTAASAAASDQKQQQTFYAIHPHGAFSFGWSALFCNPQFSHIKFCFAPALLASPFFRLFSRTTGNPGSASKADMIACMKSGLDLALPPGGFEEATLTSPQHDRVYIKKRTGFVKLCLQHGVAIRPVYVFGEKGLYWNVQGGWKFRIDTLNKNGLPAIVTWGHPLIPLLPRGNVDVRVVVGAPLILPKIDNPPKEVVQQWHAKYVAALTKLFEDHKEIAYGAEVAKTTKLEVW